MGIAKAVVVLGFVAAIATPLARADVWDTATDSDDLPQSQNTLVHGSVQVHDLSARPGPVADVDWFRVVVPPYGSFEVTVDGATGDVVPGLTMDRYEDGGATLVQSSSPADVSGHVRRLLWINEESTRVTYFIKVTGAACGTTCTTSDQYTIRARETTVSVARFNNSGSQVTVLLTQNAGDTAVNSKTWFWSPTGVLLFTMTRIGQAQKRLDVLNTSSYFELAGQSGHITIAHTAPYGKLNAKAVALEPATGFSFDTPGVIVP